MTLFTAEAKHILITKISKEMIQLKDFLEELDVKQEDYILYSDSQSTIDLAQNPVYHTKIKHVDIDITSFANF